MPVSIAAALLMPAAASAQQSDDQLPPDLVARMAAEKEARRACKIDICKALAGPGSGAIACDVTKTWSRSDIVGRIVGGSYVWGYGHMQCKLSLNLDRAELGRVVREAAAKIPFPEHKIVCTVENAAPAGGPAFSVTLAVAPVVTFEKGEAKAVDVQSMKSEGSAAASAAVAALMAADKISGAVSSAAANEINQLMYAKCKADGIEIAKK